MQGMLFTVEKNEAKPQRESEPSPKKRCQIDKLGPFLPDQVYLQDCLAGMSQLESNSIDIAIADPPYNPSKGEIWKWDNSIRLPGFGGDWSKVMAEWDNKPLAENLAALMKWISELNRLV